MTLLTILGTLLLTQGVWSQDWDIISLSQCALRGTSVIIPCVYRYPPDWRVNLVAWYRVEGRQLTDLSDIEALRGRFKYLGYRKGLCTMEINHLRYEDQGEYIFAFEIYSDEWSRRKSAYLTVKAPNVTALVPTAVKEGDMVELICETQCRGSSPQNTLWSRDGQAVDRPTFSARLEDAGSYQCAVQGLQSQAVDLDVQYLPRNTTVWVDPLGELSPGASVNLTCSSVANPPVHSYTWWYNGTAPPPSAPPAAAGSAPLPAPTAVPVGTGQVLRLPSLEASQAGSYLCKATNRLGEHSSSALLRMAYTTLSRESVFIFAGAGVFFFVALVAVLVCLWSQKKETGNYGRTKVTIQRAKSLNSSANPDQADPLYANIHFSPLTNQPLAPYQDAPYDDHRHESSAQPHGSQDVELAYFTKGHFRETRPAQHRDSHVQPEQKPFQSTEDAVIYSTVAYAT